ncbi:uncharacterized protein LOC126325522 [Schistocerca gregaria]|uniref:uncharacterized protein LOC126325522 n=1 Tax=Schistocerca gregaria TaxID=7010 RepID=UPI00211E8663|nr:uncharacterized protein LOC126325522 [Schistocerca gregaria]
MSLAKKRSKDGPNVVVAGSSRSSSESAFVGQPVYVNRLPDLPCEAKMLKIPLDAHRFTAYRPNMLEQRYHYEAHKGVDLDLDFDLVDALNWESPWAKLDILQPSKRLARSTKGKEDDKPIMSYEEYLKKKKSELRSIQNEAKQKGIVAASDSTLPLDKQLSLIPKEQQEIFYSLKVLPSTASVRIMPVAGTVPWLKHTEYISGDRDLSRFNTTPNISSLLMEEDSDLEDEGIQETGVRNLGTKTDKNISILNSYMTISEETLKRAIGDIESSFEVIESRSAIFHPTRAGKQDVHIVEEWDVLPDETLWPTNYASVQLDVGECNLWKTLVPKLDDQNELNAEADQTPELPILLPIRVKPDSLLSWSPSLVEKYGLDQSRVRASVSKAKPELLALLVPNNQEKDDVKKSTKYNQARFYQVETENLQPSFESSGSYIFMMSPTVVRAEEDDEKCQENTNESAKQPETPSQQIKVGIATFKSVDAHFILKKPSLKDRQKVKAKNLSTHRVTRHVDMQAGLEKMRQDTLDQLKAQSDSLKTQL